MNEFKRLTNMEKNKEVNSKDSYFAIFNKQEIVYKNESSGFEILDLINLLRHFGILQMLKFFKWIRKMISDFHGYK